MIHGTSASFGPEGGDESPHSPMKLRILIVEDEAVSAADLHDELIAQGYEVTGIADTAADAFRLAEEGGPDLVLMDINLEEPADGIHAALALRSIGIPVISLTAHYDERTLDRAKRAKPVGFIAKPFKPHDLPIAIEIGIARHRSEAELARLGRELAEARDLLQDHAANLEGTVNERTVELRTALDALKAEVAERHRLQFEVLGIAEEERCRVAADLHDGICQELVSIQVHTHLLGDQLEAEVHPLAADARGIEASISDTTRHSRQVARGMTPVVAEGGGLAEALRLLTESTANAHKIECFLECPSPVSIDTPATANELYRIAQEAIHNAIQHGRAKRITVRLLLTEGTISLGIIDDGCGLPPPDVNNPGMGLRVMGYRAALIGGRLGIAASEDGGTEVTCHVHQSVGT